VTISDKKTLALPAQPGYITGVRRTDEALSRRHAGARNRRLPVDGYGTHHAANLVGGRH